jgi:hypothetical protein
MLKIGVIELLRDRVERRILRDPSIREYDVELAFLPLDLHEEAIQIGEVRPFSIIKT